MNMIRFIYIFFISLLQTTTFTSDSLTPLSLSLSHLQMAYEFFFSLSFSSDSTLSLLQHGAENLMPFQQIYQRKTIENQICHFYHSQALPFIQISTICFSSFLWL